MRKSASKFIELLETRQLLSGEVIAELRRQLSESSINLPPELLARLLVENGHLTKFQATKLISEISPSSAEETTASSSTKELGLAPSREAAEAILEEPSDSTAINAIAIVEDAVPVVSGEPIQSGSSVSSRSGNASGKSSSRKSSVQPVVGSSQGPPGSAPGDLSEVSDQTAGNPSGVLATEVPKIVRNKQSKENPWDSFRILGIGVLLSLVLILGFFLVRWMIRGSADDAIKFADNAYQQRSYEDAANAYRNFFSSWPTHEKSSYAKVRSVLAAFRKDSETAPNPVVGLRTAEELLPTLRGESALPDQQADLAGALVSLAEKFISRIDGTKGSDARKDLMSEMDRLMGMIGDPQFFGSSQRTQLAPTLQRVEESRSRLRREIQRDDELIAALAEMDQQLEAQEVIQAYETRSRLINRHPLLEAHPDLKQRVLRASTIQKALVKDSPLPIRVSTSMAEQPARAFVLTHQSGSPVNALNGTMVYHQSKGSVFGIDASTGRVQWRRWVGRGLNAQPVRLDDTSDTDLLATQTQTGQLLRMDGSTGEVRWQADFNEMCNSPAVQGENIFVSTQTGTVACLDAETGQSKWQKQLPQSTDVGPASSSNGQLLYQPALHSNIYVLDRRDGSCVDVFYLGHREGSVRVPPVVVLGHLILIENINVDTAKILILEISDEGLAIAQSPISIDGNVDVPPSIDGRQILIQSNLGNSLVLDVEPTSTSEKVTVTARVPRNLDAPQTIWTAFDRNQVWVAENRLARFDLVVTQGKLNRRWIQHEGDQFIAPLQIFDQALIHTRRPQSNQGVKISAANADTGNSSWELDFGAPIALLTQTSDNRFDVVTNNGSYYSLNEDWIRHQADANPGEGKALKRLSAPTWLDDNRAVMLNLANAREFALFSSEGTNRLRMLAVPLGSAPITCDPVAVGDRVVVGLGNGNLVMFDPDNGVLAGTPYQAAPARPGSRVLWNQPVFLPESSSLIAASDAGQMIRLSVGESLRALSEETLEHPIVGPLAVFGDRIVGVQSTDRGSFLALFNPQSLKKTDEFALDGRLLAGPFGHSQGGFVQTERGLVAFDAAGTKIFTSELPSSPLVGAPVLSGDKIFLTNRVGQLWILDSKTGSIQASLDLGQTLSTPPVIRGNRVLVGGDDGTVLVVPIPSEHTLAQRE